jgi:hypothetical protein
MDGILRFSGGLKYDPAVDSWFEARNSVLGAIARRWFSKMRKCGSDVRELVHDGCPVACVQDAPFAYVNVFTAHASVGFFRGDALPDPSGLLEGRGKRMRHVKLKTQASVDSHALDELIRCAYEDMKARL